MPAGSAAVVLSIQSHVTYGYVGNKAATFPMQLHGFDVCPIHTVNFANHSGYPVVKGTRTTREQLDGILEGLEANGLLCKVTHVLSGYIGTSEVLAGVAAFVKRAKVDKNIENDSPRLLFLCDPVCGDEGKLYVTQAVVEGYADALSVADLATPNGFEAEALSGRPVRSIADACSAAEWFLATYPTLDVIVIKSFADPIEDPTHQYIFLVAVSRSLGRRCHARIPKVEGYFTGTGDLFAAMFLVHWTALKDDLGAAVMKTCACLLNVIRLTKERGSKELLIVEGRRFLEGSGDGRETGIDLQDFPR